jgi:hypothetical protein
VAGVNRVVCLFGVGAGGGVRYFGEALLAVWYGERAAQFLRDNARPVSVGLAAAVLAGGLAWIWYHKRKDRTSVDGNP